MNPWVRMARLAATVALVVGCSAVGLHYGGQSLGVVGLLAGGSLAFALLFLTTPTCDECGSLRVNRINSSPLKCGRCGYLHDDTTEHVVLTDPLIRTGDSDATRPDGSGWLGTLRLFALGGFGIGVVVIVYSITGLAPPNLFDPETWNAATAWRIMIAVFGLALNTVSLMVYIISYELV